MLSENEERECIENVAKWSEAKRRQERNKRLGYIDAYARVAEAFAENIDRQILSVAIIDTAQRSAKPLKTGPKIKIPEKRK